MVRVGTSRESNRRYINPGMSSEDDQAIVAVSPQFSDQISNVIFQLTDVFNVHSMAARLIVITEIRPIDFRRTRYAHSVVATGAPGGRKR
jgi:hypothetical protein